MESLDARLVEQALNYHGEPLQKVWESRRDSNELQLLNLKEPSFEIFQQRQKTLSYSDSEKRLKLHQFIAKKADVLYDKSSLEIIVEPIKQQVGNEVFYGTMPGIDSFVSLEKSQRIRNLLESLVVGDIIYAQVMGKSAVGLLLKILCNGSDCPRVVSNLGIKALILNSATVPAVDKKSGTRGYLVNDLVCVCVSEVNIEAERVIAVMNVTPREGLAPHPALGLIHFNDLPEAYKKVMNDKEESFESIMENSTGFMNPNNIKYLCDLLSLGQANYSNMVGLRKKFPPNEYGIKLRQAQASKWAFRSVADGIDHFKAGRHTEAFQCFNKALVIDPLNDEGLVARGCLYATSGSLKKAIDDFEMVLKLNKTHSSARKYLTETLIALGRSYVEEKNFEEAQAVYEKCLVLCPNHEGAKKAIEFLKIIELGEGDENNLETFNSVEAKIDFYGVKEDKKKRKMKRKSRSKKTQRWSSTSSSSSNDSSKSESSSSSSSSNSRSTSHSPSRKRKSENVRASLSPLSKRMALYNNPPEASNTLPDFMFPTASGSKNEIDNYETQVRKFLDQTKDDSDCEEKVRIFVEAAARWKKEREKEKKHDNEKSKKRRKKERKAKDKEEKKNRKKKKREERKRHKANKEKMEREMEILDKSSLPDFHQLESKLTAYYTKVQRKPIPDSFEEESKFYSERKVYSPNTSALNTKIKTAQTERQKDLIDQNWQEFSVDNEYEQEKRMHSNKLDTSLNIRKQMHHEQAEKKHVMDSSVSASLKEIPLPRQTPEKRLSGQSQSNFQSSAPLTKSSYNGNQPPEPPGRPLTSKPRSPSKSPRDGFESEEEHRRYSRRRESNGRSMTRRMSKERPVKRSEVRSRNVSSSSSSKSHSPKRSKSRSYSDRSRKSRSFERKYSRSISRSYSKSLSRSRSRTSSRSRSRSGERRYRHKQSRPYNNHGGYYNPRFQGHNQNYRGGQNYQNGNRFYNNQNNRYNHRRGFQPRHNNYHSPNYRGRGYNRGGRFFHNNRQGYRDFRDNRREFRDRRSYSRERYSDRSISPDPMRKVDEAKKKINKILESDNQSNRHSPGPAPDQSQEVSFNENEEKEYDYKRCSDEDKSENKVD